MNVSVRKVILTTVLLIFITTVISLVFYSLFESTNSNIVYSKLIGGNNNEFVKAIDVDSEDNIIIAGWAESDDYKTLNAYDSTYGGQKDGIITKFSSNSDIIWSTYFGGSKEDIINSIAIDNQDNIYVTGVTFSNEDADGFPILNPENPSKEPGSNSDAFVSKITPSGDLLWSTYLGGGENDFSTGIAIDSNNNVIVVGYTVSQNGFPKEGGSLPFNHKLNNMTDSIEKYDGYIVKYDPEGDIIWSSYFGGEDTDLIYGVDIDSKDSIIVIGYTTSQKFPLLNSSLPKSPNRDLFVAKFETNGPLIWSSIIGTNTKYTNQFVVNDDISIAIDSNYDIIVGGWTNSSSFASVKAFGKPNIDDSRNGFLTKLSYNATIVWSRLIGGNNDDILADIAINSNNEIIVIGETNSINFPILKPYYYSYGEFGDVFISKFNRNGDMEWSSFLTGGFYDNGLGIEIDSLDMILITGITSSNDFPLSSSQSVKGYIDIFYAKLKEPDSNFGSDKIPNNIIYFANIIIENTSIFELIILIGAIAFSFRTLYFYQKTKIFEYLIFTGIFITIALNSFLPLLAFAFRNQNFSNLILLLIKQPYIGLTLYLGY